MIANEPTESTPKAWPWRVLALVAILSAAALRLLYLARDCPLDLAPDEAHYWDWSRHLDWSYYSKGPLVAYLIRFSCWLAGDWSRSLIGSEMLAVRLPAVVCGSLLLISLYVLTVQVFRSDKLALGIVVFCLTQPIMAAGASLMTIDAPYTCCWGWALVFGHLAVLQGRRWAWPIAGLLVGVGILAKYTMVLWLPSLGLFLLATPAFRGLLRRPGFWVMSAIAAVCCLPILIWNMQHDWVTIRHAFDSHIEGGNRGLRWMGPLNYVSVQFLMLLGFGFIAWIAAMIAHRPTNEPRPEVRYLWWMSAPMFVFFGLFSVKNGGGEPNWPVTAYLSGLVLAGAWVARQLQEATAGRRLALRISLGAACGIGLVLTILAHDSRPVQPLLVRIAGPATAERGFPLRHYDPTCRLRGWRTLAAAVDEVREELRQQGIEPVVAGMGWNMPGQLAFYCDGHPTVYSVGLALGDRHSQYDLWHPNPLADKSAFEGRTFILVGGGAIGLEDAFTTLDSPRKVTYSENGQPISAWTIIVGHGYRGLTVKGNMHH